MTYWKSLNLTWLFFMISGFFPLLAQRVEQPDNRSLQTIPPSFAEKIYLQLDGKVYTKGNIIWFKSLVLSTEDHRPSSLSGILYVELVDSDQRIMERKLIKLEKGIGKGFFELFESYAPGTYLIRAFTNWNKNFGPDFFFKEYIQVFDDPSILGQPISNVKLIKEEAQAYLLTASFNPLVVDSLYQNKLKVSITLDEKVDSMFLKRDKEDNYLLNYSFSKNSRLARLKMQTENDEVYASTIILDQNSLDIQFLPESGELVHGLKSKLGFKALDASGKGKMVAGDIVDEQGQLINSFQSNTLGMGSFILDSPDSTKKYYARIKSVYPESKSLLYPLPKVAALGNVLTIEKHGNNLLLTTQSNYMKNDSIFLMISHRGNRLYDLKVRLLQNGTSKLEIPCQKLPEGIISFTMMDNSGRPVAERIYFNENPVFRIRMELSVDQESYEKRDETKLNIETTDHQGNPLPAKLSLLAISKKQLGSIQQERQNILSYFLLDSELKGEIENPGFYFNKDSSMHDHLDALMLTQGWRKYNYNKPDVMLTNLPETRLTISGQVSSVFSEKKKKQPKLTLTTFGNNPTVDVQEVDSLGNFTFTLNDEYGQQVNVMIQSTTDSGKKKNYSIRLNENESPTVNFNLKSTIMDPDSLVNDFIRKNIQQKKIDRSFEIDSGSIVLDELEFTGIRLTEDQEEVREKYGDSDIIISGAAIVEKEQKWSTGLFNVLQMNFPDKIQIVRRQSRLIAFVSGADATLVVIDGIPVEINEYPLIQNIPPSEVKSFEIIECANNFDGLYLKVFGLPSPREQCGAIIAIYTYGGKSIFGTQKSVGLLHTSIPVFSAPREFYEPKYSEDQPNLLNDKPDLRTLIHWEPDLQTNATGKITRSFYNGDNVGKMLVVIEAVSVNGLIGYQELEYVVEGQETVVVEY